MGWGEQCGAPNSSCSLPWDPVLALAASQPSQAAWESSPGAWELGQGPG